MRRRSFRGVIDVVFGGEKPVEKKIPGKGANVVNKDAKGKEKVMNELKRKAGENLDAEAVGKENGQALSKREMKRRAARARMAKVQEEGAGPGNPSCAFFCCARPVAVPGSVTITDGSTPEVIVGIDPDKLALELIADDVASALLAERRPLEEDTTTLLARSAEATVWNVDICSVDGATVWAVLAVIWYAAIGNAAMGQRQAQLQGPDGMSEGAKTAVDADESGGLAVLLGLGIVGEIDGVTPIGSKAPAGDGHALMLMGTSDSRQNDEEENMQNLVTLPASHDYYHSNDTGKQEVQLQLPKN
ncbi:MAG: hypothetical protein Q9200_006923 [Gallowayella weberi]